MFRTSFVVILLSATAAVRGDLIVGNKQIAWDYFHGDTHLLGLGDSLQGNVNYYRYQNVKDMLTGYVLGANMPVAPWLGDAGAWRWDFNPVAQPVLDSLKTGGFLARETPPDAVRGASPGATHHAVFSGLAPAAESSVLTNALDHYVSTAPFATAPGTTLHATVLTVANPAGSNVVRFESYDASAPTGAPAAVSFILDTRSATTQLQQHRFDLTTGSGGGNALVARVDPTATPEAGSNFIFSGVRLSSGKPGLQLDAASYGGMRTAHYLDPENCSDENLARYLAYTDTNTIQVWLGQNDCPLSPEEYGQQMRALIDRYRKARPGIHFIFESTFATAPMGTQDPAFPQFAGYAEQLTAIAAADPDVLLLNLYEAVGGDAFARSPYLADGVHPSPAGAEYLANLEYSLLQQAASQVPEPTTAALAALSLLFLGGRSRRR